MADFEKASTLAIKYHFPNVNIKGCWFHYRQAIYRRAVKIGLKQYYGKDEYREFLNIFGALALIPSEKVLEGYEILKKFKPNDEKCDEMMEYFDRIWLKSKMFIFNLMHKIF